jgi:hypothetical protein
MKRTRRTRHWAPLAAFGAATLLLGGAAAPTARATDHNNIDAGRPLSFEDASSIAYGERTIEFGVRGASPRGTSAGLGFGIEYLVGFARNSHLGVDLGSSIGGRAGSGDTRADLDEVGLSLFHNFNREVGNAPALSVRADTAFQTGRSGGGTEFRLRGILSKTARQYDRLHLNLDAHFAPNAGEGERTFRAGAVLGYSMPLGYPTRFDRTGLAEVAIQQSEEKGTGPVVTLGLGLRQQTTPTSVLDLGLQSDVSGARGAARDDVRLIAGYSTAF